MGLRSAPPRVDQALRLARRAAGRVSKSGGLRRCGVCCPTRPVRVVSALPLRLARFPLRLARFPLRLARFPLRLARFPLRLARFPLRLARFPLTPVHGVDRPTFSQPIPPSPVPPSPLARRQLPGAGQAFSRLALSHFATPTCCERRSAGVRIVSAGEDAAVRVWDIRTHHCLYVLSR